MRILIKPSHRHGLNNKLFESSAFAPNWSHAPRLLRELAVKRSWEMDTWDVWPIESADVILFHDLPGRRSELLDVRARNPYAKFVLEIVESPLCRGYAHDPKNFALFDLVITYNYRLCTSSRYVHYDLPNSPPTEPPIQVPHGERKVAVLCSTNRICGALGQRVDKGLRGLPVIGVKFSGWRVSWRDWLMQHSGELYSARSRLVRLASRDFPGALEVWGAGWRGEPISWAHRIVSPKPYVGAKGPFEGDKLVLLSQYRFTIAYENVEGDYGYISEKIYDALFAGSVPVYRGAKNILDHVPSSCFIAASDFRSEKDMLSFLKHCSEREWSRYYEAGRNFINSATLRCTPQKYAASVIRALDQVTRDVASAERLSENAGQLDQTAPIGVFVNK